MDKADLLELIISKNNTVTKSNLLIEAEYYLSPTEFKLIQTVFSNVQPGDTSTSRYIFPIKQFLEMLDLKGRSGYAELKKITFNLFKKPISITIDGETTQLTWLSMVNYNDRKGTITIEVNKFWEKYLLSLTNNFTSYKLFNITNLKSSYSLRLYELLKSRINLNSVRVITLKELRAKMGIEDAKYPKYANFKQRVLLKAQEELKAESDIYFDFKEIKKGRSVDKIEFTIYRNRVAPETAGQVTINAVIEDENSLASFGLSPKTIDKITEKYSKEQINDNALYTKMKMLESEIDNPAAYLVTAIENNYASTGSTRKTNSKSSNEKEKQDEQLANLKVNNEEFENKRLNKTPSEIETHLLKVKEVKELLDASDEETEKEIFKQLSQFQEYQDQHHGKFISPSEFQNPYIQQVCKKVLEIYLSVLT